jgi:hypothetical protein
MTATKKGEKKAKMFDFSNATFEDIISQDDKELKNQISKEQKMKGKMIQLTGKVNELNMRIMRSETEFNQSLVDPTKDSVEIGIQIKCDKEELAFAIQLFNQLFPKQKNNLLMINS